MKPTSTSQDVYVVRLTNNAIRHRRVTTSDLVKCLKGVKNAKSTEKPAVCISLLSSVKDMLNAQNSDCHSKKLKIINKIAQQVKGINKNIKTNSQYDKTTNSQFNEIKKLFENEFLQGNTLTRQTASPKYSARELALIQAVKSKIENENNSEVAGKNCAASEEKIIAGLERNVQGKIQQQGLNAEVSAQQDPARRNIRHG